MSIRSYRQYIKESIQPFGKFFKNIKVVDLADASTLLPHAPVNEAEEPMAVDATQQPDKGNFNKLNAPDVPKTDDELYAYLGRVLKGEKLPKEKFLMPFVHRSTTKLALTNRGEEGMNELPPKGWIVSGDPNADGVLDTETGQLIDKSKLMALIMQRPPDEVGMKGGTKGGILKQNQKMMHSIGQMAKFVNFTIPALLALVVDESAKELKVIKTCPGAGSCAVDCYALKGNFTFTPKAVLSASQKLNFMLNEPEMFTKQIGKEVAHYEAAATKKKAKLFVRWHDAGDFFSEEYFQFFINTIVRKFPNVEFYIYTKMASVALSKNLPDNFVVNFSGGAKDSETKQIDFTKVKHSHIVPYDVFRGLLKRVPVLDKKGQPKFMSKKGQKIQVFGNDYLDQKATDTLKKRLAEKYHVDVNTILTYDEMLEKPLGTEMKWNVIVVPNRDGDVSATRRDVLGTYLLKH